MTKRRWRILLILVALLGFAVLWVTSHNFRAKRALRAYKAELVAKGEKLTIDELTPPSSSEAQKAANDLVQAALQLRSGKAIPYNLPGAMRCITPGKAMIGWEQPDIRWRDQSNSWDELMEDLKMNTPALEQIRDALKSPRLDTNLDYKQGFTLLLPHLAKLKSIAQWLSAETESDLHAGRINDAAASLNALLSLADGWRDERLIISQLVRIAIAAIAIGPTWEALQADGLTDAQLAELQRRWASLGFMTGMENAVEMERAMGMEMFERLRHSSDERRRLFNSDFFGAIGVSSAGSTGPPPPTNFTEVPEFALEWSKERLSSLGTLAQCTSWRWFWSYDDELRYVKTLQLTVEVPRRARASRSFVSAQAWVTSEHHHLWQSGDAGSSKYFVSRTLERLENVFAKAARIETQRELVVTAIALKRYQARYGKPAPDLASLVAEFLPQTPKDFMDGNELRYRLNADGSFLLYSVNDDGKDDGGDPRPESPGSGSYYWGNGRDMVWPIPATAAEIGEAEAKETRKNSGAGANRQMLERYGLLPTNKTAKP